MNLQTIANVVIVLLLVGWIGYRQLQWRPVVVSRMWRTPIVLGVLGLFLLSNQTKGSVLTAFDVGVLVIELVIAVGVGAIMGRIAQFRPLATGSTPPAAANPALATSRTQHPAEFASRTGWVGMVLWVIMIGVRIGIEIWATRSGSTIAASTGIILLVLAANRLSRTAVFAVRVARLDAAAITPRG